MKNKGAKYSCKTANKKLAFCRNLPLEILKYYVNLWADIRQKMTDARYFPLRWLQIDCYPKYTWWRHPVQVVYGGIQKDLCALTHLGLKWLLHFLTLKYRFLLRALTFLLSFWFMAIQLFQSTHIFNRETGAVSQLAESSTKQWRLADTFVCGRGVPIGNFVRPYLHFKGKEQGRIDLTLTLWIGICRCDWWEL